MIEVLYFTLFVVLFNLLTGSFKSKIFYCGLVGFSGEGNFNISLLRTLLWHNSIARKSTDATGMFTPSMGVVKSTDKASDFFNKEDKMNLLEELNEPFMGHVRAATVGDKTDPSSAHPWDFGDIVMMHNGTIKEFSYKKIASDYKLKDEDWKVDSQVLGMAIQDNFAKGEPFKVLSEYCGAAAVILYHKKRDSLFVYRDEERTLSYGYLNESEMYISSESDILNIIGCKNIKSFEPYKVYEIKNGKIISKMKTKPKKARKNTLIQRVVDSAKSIFWYKSYSIYKTFLKGDFTGISHTIAKSYMLDGYKLESTSNINGNTETFKAKLTRGKFYKVSETKRDDYVKVMDDNNTYHDLHIGVFNVRDFIPMKGNYIVYEPYVINQSISLKKDSIYEVVHHTYGFDEILVLDHMNGVVVKLRISDVRVASLDELREYFKDTGGISKTIKYESDEEENTVTSIQIIDDPETKEESIDVNEEIHKNLKTALNLIKTKLSIIKNSVEKLVPKKDLEDIELIEEFISKCDNNGDKYILNINENSLTNYAECK